MIDIKKKKERDCDRRLHMYNNHLYPKLNFMMFIQLEKKFISFVAYFSLQIFMVKDYVTELKNKASPIIFLQEQPRDGV